MKKHALLILALFAVTHVQAELPSTSPFSAGYDIKSADDSPEVYLRRRLDTLLEWCKTSLSFATNPDDRAMLKRVLKLKEIQKPFARPELTRALIEPTRSVDSKLFQACDTIIDALACETPDDMRIVRSSTTRSPAGSFDDLNNAIEAFGEAHRGSLIFAPTSALETVERVALKSLVHTLYMALYANKSTPEKGTVDWQKVGLQGFRVTGKLVVDELIPNHHVGIPQRVCELLIPYIVAYGVAKTCFDDTRNLPSGTLMAITVDAVTSASKARFYTETPELRTAATGWACVLPFLLAYGEPKNLLDDNWWANRPEARKAFMKGLEQFGLGEVLPALGDSVIHLLPERLQSSPRKKAVIGMGTTIIPALVTLALSQRAAEAA